jgi:ubiquitin thioesterase OTU1
VIATAVQSSPGEWSEAVLGKAPSAYCDWIALPSSWGGAIELSILSRHFGREIAAFDIQTERCDVYGQGAGFSERVLVVYDGAAGQGLGVEARVFSLGLGCDWV